MRKPHKTGRKSTGRPAFHAGDAGSNPAGDVGSSAPHTPERSEYVAGAERETAHDPRPRFSAAVEELLRLLDESGATLSWSPHCRSGVVGDLCRCWRCRGEDGPTEDEATADRERELVDRAIDYGRTLQRMADRARR